MDIFAVIAERKIVEAMARGEFDDLPGRGRPLRLQEELAGVPAELRMAYTLMKNAGYVPPEVELRREIVTLRAMLETLEDETERRRRRQELHAKRLRLSLLLKHPVPLEDLPEDAGQPVTTPCG